MELIRVGILHPRYFREERALFLNPFNLPKELLSITTLRWSLGLSQTPTGEEERGGRLGVFTTFSRMLKGNAGQGMDMASKSQDPA